MTVKKSAVLYQSGNPVMDIFRDGLFRGVGMETKEMKKKPLIAIANSHSELTTGHSHLSQLADRVKAGVLAAGGEVVEFNVPAPCDGIAMGHDGMRYILAQRDLIADVVETHVRSQRFDGLVMIASCDKINPAMMMAAARLDMPSIYLAGGPGMYDIRNKAGYTGSIDHGDYMDDPENLHATVTCASCGACEIMGTANTFQCLAEAMGICLPGSSNVPAFHSDKLIYARKTGERIVQMVDENLTFGKVVTKAALINAVVMNMAIGGSTNTTLHLPAIAHSLGLELPLSVFEEYSRKVPTLLAISPNGPWGVTDMWAAGGMPAVLKVMQDDLDLTCLSVAGCTIGDIVAGAKITNEQVIPARDKPFRHDGGIAVLTGNLAPEGSVIKQAGVRPDQMLFTGEAICFDTEEAAMAAIFENKIKKFHVIVLRYLGPQGAPGMPEMLGITAAVKMGGLQAAVITDGRFSGGTSGPSVGHISPEASRGGPIAAVEDGDMITIDVQARSLTLEVAPSVIEARLKSLTPVVKDVPRGFLGRYRKHVSSATTGAVLD
ncbi:MAG: dihydroxy-acid dehydratase [Kordiimonadaceae bacterium]|nr:dihydroxy-acid dehydratase [Kordiimonadaceae bacterium]